MSLTNTIQGGRGRPRPALAALLAGLGWLALCLCSTAQVSVDTIGGGVRYECESASGFVGGNTYETAQFNAPYACALDTNGNLWIADKNNSDVEEVSQAGNKSASVTTEYASASGYYHYFTNVIGVAVDPANNLYVLLPSPAQVIKYSLVAEPTDLTVLSDVVVTGVPAATAMTVDGSSNVFLAFTNGEIIRFQLLGTTLPPVHYVVSSFNWQPAGLALRTDGRLAVSDVLNNAIYVVSTNDGSSPQLLTGGNGAGFFDGPSGSAQFDQPCGIAASADGRLIVCDTGNNRVRAIDTSANTTTLYGTISSIWSATCCVCDPTHYAGWVDGVAGSSATNATGRQPAGVCIGPSGSLFVTELYYSLIRQVTNCTFTPVNLSATTPIAATTPASGITSSNATLNGTVNAGDQTTTYYFEWGTTASYGTCTPTNTLTTYLTSAQEVSQTLSFLLPGTTYHFQLVAVNNSGTSYGGDVSFFTPAEPAVAITEPATGITASNATLNATIDAEYSQTTVYFQWGSTTNLGNVTTPTNLTTSLSTYQPVSWTLGNLQAGTVYYYQVAAADSGGTSFGSQLLFSTASIAVPPAPTLSFSPSNGYFPECVTISVTSSATNVYYTTDGSTPTSNSAAVTMSGAQAPYVGLFEWCNSQQDLSALRVIAFNGASSTLVQGGSPTTNFIGFSTNFYGGTGGHLYIPVVVNLQSNTVLKSLQFRVEINPNQGNPPSIQSISLQPLTANDFVPLPGPAPGNAPVAFETFAYPTSSNGQGLVITASGNGSGLDMTGAGVVVLLHFAIPTTATNGQSYFLNLLYPSGTSDGEEAAVGLAALPVQTLTISDSQYLVGDSSPSIGYNAGQFGSGELDNADVNNAIYASVGIRVPPSDSDIYNAMDAWPPDSAGRGGDGFIRLLDWETILGRSLGVAIYPGMDTNNYVRFWTNGDSTFPSHIEINWYPGGPSLPVGPASKLLATNPPPGLVWFCNASFRSGAIIDALPGNTYSLPVSVNVLPGYSLSAMQFRAIVAGSSGAPAVAKIQFNPAGGVAEPQVLAGLAGNDAVHVWPFGSIAAPLQGSNYLGTISFQVPPGAPPEACYALHFLGVDGAPDSSTQYQLESFPGFVWVMSAAMQAPSITSDEWKIAFFGSVTNSLAADNVDADGDGALNWQEYVAGTNPTNALSRLQFGSASFYNNGVSGVAIDWLTAPGKNYILQSSPAVRGANWTAINTNSGDGNEYQFIVTNYSGAARFFQIRVQP